ncbi:MAG: EAL domain-containing protein [Lachnospiraceae bacterium]|nr:EAL domain-containing protein [Lachnospiraceae bacterium]
MHKISFRELVNLNELQKIQNEFCRVTGVAGYCVDEENRHLTMPSGKDKTLALLQGKECNDRLTIMLERVQDGSLEDMAVEEMENIEARIAAVAVRVKGMATIYWVVMDTSKEEMFHFYHILDLLRDISLAMCSLKVTCFSAEAENRQNQYAEQEKEWTRNGVETLTQMIQLLDSDEQVELIMDKWLTIVSEYMKVDTAEIFQTNADITKMDVICEWCKDGLVSFFDKNIQVNTYSFLRAERPVVISSNSLESEYQQEIDAIGMKAVIIFPVIKDDAGRLTLLSLNHRLQKHVWNMAEIKYTVDAVKILQSILGRRIQKYSISSSYSTMCTIFDNVGCSVYVEDKLTGKPLFVNKRMQRIFFNEMKEGNFTEILESVKCNGTEGNSYEYFYSQHERWYDFIHKEITWVDGKRATMYSIYDITEKKLYQRRIEQQLSTDFLTGLYNRMCCERDLARRIDEAEKAGERGALLYLDLDDFKHINEGLGHQYGDVLLKAISHSLQRIEGIENTCYRVGGDEFVIVVPPESYSRLEAILKDIENVFNRPWFLKDADYYCTMSMGIVTYPDGGNSVADLIKKADIALYEAKNTGKNRVTQYSEGKGSISGRRLDMEKNMRDAALDDYKEFQVYYQPIINVTNGRTVCEGAEALIRWNSEKLGFISPAEFIPLAEYLGLINPIGNHVLKEACCHCKAWNDQGFPNYKVNVNLSVVQLLQTDIVDIVERILKETGLNPKNLTLEVTESLAINDIERMKEILRRIKALGVEMALDDFGTGYSSLNHIRELPFDIIKVDQSFVRDLAEDAYSRSFIKMVAELAETIGMSICVEGIETEIQYKALHDMKVKYIQGYYFDRPMPRTDFEKKYLGGACQKSPEHVI